MLRLGFTGWWSLKRRFGARWLAAILILTGGLDGADTWVKVVAPNFTVYSSAPGKDTLRVAQDFGAFIDSLGQVLRGNPAGMAPLTIVIFGREKEFRAYRPRRPNGKPWDVAGFFSRQETWAVFGLSGPSLDDEVRRTVLHEGVHWFLSGVERPNPPWLEEGLAEVFSTFQVEGNRRQWGHPIENHVLLCRQERPLPLERLLAVSRSDPLFNESNRTSLFYAESWAFVHFLLFSENSRTRSLFNDFIVANASGVHPDDAFKQAFGNDYAAMDRQLTSYLRTGKYFVSASPLGIPTTTLKVEPANELDRLLALARLALGAGNLELAAQHAATARRLGPGSAQACELEGYVAQARDDIPAMLDAFNAAARLGSRDYGVYYTLAQREHAEAAGLGGIVALSGGTARQIADNYARAAELRPASLVAYQGFASVIELAGQADPGDQVVMEAGHARFPRDGQIQLGLALVAIRDGRRDEAQRWLDRVLSTIDEHPPLVQASARRLDAGWRYDVETKRIQALVDAERFREALGALDALIAHGLPAGAHSFMAMNRANLEANMNMQDAEKAWNDQRWADARRSLEAVIASPVQGGAQQDARRRLAHLKKFKLGAEPEPATVP